MKTQIKNNVYKNIFNVLLLQLMLLAQIIVAQTDIKKKDKNIDTNYERSSLYTLMVTKDGRNYEEDIKQYFISNYLPDKYNDHNLKERIIDGNLKSSRKTELENAIDYLEKNKIAHNIVAKWFNRTEKGGFDTKLIEKRGFYNAQFSDVIKAKNSLRGIAGIGDAATSLIDNTFVLVIDSRYTNKEEVAKAASSVFNSLLAYVPMSSNNSAILQLADVGVKTFGKGFVVATNAHLFKLVWNEEVEARFFTELWATDKDITPAKKKAFDEADFFKLEYVGTDKSYADIQSTSLTTKTNQELIGRATLKSIDNVIAKMQSSYDVFSLKTPVFSTDPLTCKIGLKESITKKSKFEILEKEIDQANKISFKRVGMAKVDSNYPIWDNQYGADEENPNQKVDATHLKLISGKEIAPGMLVRQIK